MALDPLSSQGVLEALESGLRAARAVDDFLRGDRPALVRYREEIESGFDDYLRVRAGYYGRERRWPESIFWRRRHGPPGARHAAPEFAVPRASEPSAILT
jgi:hypothetical protein